MKTLTRITLIVAGLATAALPALTAADTTPAPATTTTTTTPAPAAKHPRLRARLAFRQFIGQRVAKKLGLSSDQMAQLKADRTQTATAVKAIRADTSLTPDQRKSKVRETVQMARTQMLGVLTPDQQAKLQKLQARWRASS
jgi:Spy/CpxP family protein refolding chaperone